MRTVPAPGLPTVRLTVLAAMLACATGCSEGDIRPVQTCLQGEDWTGRAQPFHTITIDNVNDFDREHERFAVSGLDPDSNYTVFATWDECTFYLGYEGAPFGTEASAHRYLTVYFNTDPLGDDGVDEPKDYGVPRPRLPFHAEYFLEVRTDGHTEYKGEGPDYQGNVQLYHARGGWGRGLMRDWKPLQPEELTVGHGQGGGFVEIAIPLHLLGDPCAVEIVGWVVDEESDTGFGYWPPPVHHASPKAAQGSPSGLVLTDSLALDYWGFMLLDGQTPSADENLNRTQYDEVGDCAYGVVHDA